MNRFYFTPDKNFEELREAEYLKLAVPTEMGGHGMNLAEYGELIRELSTYAPATALATNMHVYWTGIAADLLKAGDNSMQFVLDDVMAGEVLAAGHSEAGNDLPLLYSLTNAERVEGGYRFTGRKGFGSLSPVWTRLGLHGMDSSDPDNPKIVHAFMNRDAEGYTIKDTWDTMGMRATASQDTILEGVFVPDDRIVRVIPAGFGGADMFIVAVFAWALIGFANVYYGLAKRACELTLASLKDKKSMAVTSSLLTEPALTLPGQRTMQGTRIPPSQTCPLCPRSAPLSPPSPRSRLPLSEVKITIVLSARPRLSSSAMSTPVLQSMAATAAP